MSGIRFIHTADLHLGSPLKTTGEISKGLQKSLKESTYRAVERIVDAAIEFDVDFVLVCGDIYDNEARSVKGSLFFTEELRRLEQKEIPVFIIYGNHDPAEKGADFFKLPQNVKVFSAENAEMHPAGAKSGKAQARIVGQSYRGPREPRKMHLNYSPPFDERINIAMLHTGLSSSSNAYVPCSAEELKGRENVHYWALGHIHAPTIISSQNPAIAYPGIPQGRDVGETGLKGCFLVEMGSPGAVSIKFIPTSPVVWHSCRLTLDDSLPLKSLDDLEELITEQGEELIDSPLEIPHDLPTVDNGFEPEGHVVRWEIGGRSPIYEELVSGREQEIADILKNNLNRRLAAATPYLWTEGIKLRLGPPIPDLAVLLQQDETIKMLHEVKEKILKDENLKNEALSAMGGIWYRPRGEDDLREDTFPVTDEKLRSLLEDAFDAVMERILKERESR